MDWHRQIPCLSRRRFCLAVAAGLAAGSAVGKAENLTRATRLKPIGGRPYPPVITALSVSADGLLLAAAGDDHAIRILDTESMETKRVLAGHNDWVRAVAFSADGDSLVSAGHDGQLLRWSRSEDWSCTPLMQNTPPAADVCLCPAGIQFAVVGFDSRLILGNCASGQQSQSIDLPTQDIRAVRFCSAGRQLLIGGRDGVLRLLDVESGAVRGEYSVHRRRIRSCLFLSDGRIASAGEDGQVVILNPDSPGDAKAIQVQGAKLYSLIELPDRRLVAGGSDNLLRVFDSDRMLEIGQVVGHSGSVAALAVSKETLYSAGFDTTIRRWALHDLPGSDVIARQVSPAEYRTDASSSLPK